MKLRHPVFIRAGGFAIGWTIKAWLSTVRYRRVLLDPAAEEPGPHQSRTYVYGFWHETLLLPAYFYSRTRTKVLISEHADGELIAQGCRHLGLGVVRGSTTRGGAKVLREVMRLKDSNVVVTPDGPRGPRRQAQAGAVFLSARTGRPIVPVGFAFHRAWRLPSWDRFALPYPFTPAVGVLGHAIEVPPEVGRADIEFYRQKFQKGMDEVTALAEELADRERW